MATQTALRSKGEDTRERILAAAERLILARGYRGTSLDEILAATGLTKGAFFHHFPSKADMALALLERFWQRDRAVLVAQWEQAAALSQDPLQRVLIWFELFEQLFEQAEEPPMACLFASYLYEREQFEPRVLSFIRRGFEDWQALYADRLAPVLDERPPAAPVTVEELAETVMCLIQGGFVLSQATGDRDSVPRQSRRFRRYLELLFA